MLQKAHTATQNPHCHSESTATLGVKTKGTRSNASHPPDFKKATVFNDIQNRKYAHYSNQNDFSTARYKNPLPQNCPLQLSNLNKALHLPLQKDPGMHFEVEGSLHGPLFILTGLYIWSPAFSTVLVVLRLSSHSSLSA